MGDRKEESILRVVASPKTAKRIINAEVQEYIGDKDVKYPHYKVEFSNYDEVDEYYHAEVRAIGAMYGAITYGLIYRYYMKEVPLYIAEACLTQSGREKLMSDWNRLY